jgi:hypothetical protein
VNKHLVIAPIMFLAVVAGSQARLNAQQNHPQDLDWGFRFVPGTLVVSRSVYQGKASTVTIGETLPLGCQGGLTGLTVNVPLIAGGTTPVAVPCGVASDNGEYPNIFDTHNVWNNANSDPSFGVTSPIFLDDITTDGWTLGTLPVPTDQIVTSFSSKSELALNRSVDGRSITFVGYVGGVGCGGSKVSPTEPNLLDVSNSNTPGVCDPTNPIFTTFESNPLAPAAYYRSVAEIDADGHLTITHGNAYSGDNGRAAIKGGNGLYYAAGNDNNGNLSKKQMSTTQDGVDLSNATGAELLYPGQIAPLPPNIEMIGRLEFGTDKPAKTPTSAASPFSTTPSTSPRAAAAMASTPSTRLAPPAPCPPAPQPTWRPSLSPSCRDFPQPRPAPPPRFPLASGSPTPTHSTFATRVTALWSLPRSMETWRMLNLWPPPACRNGA